MLDEFEKNQWQVTGKIFYLKELQGEFACSLKINGVAKRPDLYSSSKLELSCLMTQAVYDDAKRRGMHLYQRARLSGHLESWCNSASSHPKVYFIADKVDAIGR